MRNEESKAMANNQFFIYHSSLHLKTTLLMKKSFLSSSIARVQYSSTSSAICFGGYGVYPETNPCL